MEPTAPEHDQGDEVGDAVEAVGHADGGLDPVVEGLEPGAGVARFDGAWDVGAASPDFFLESSTISGMRLCEARNTQRFSSPPARSRGEPEQAQRFLEPP